MKGRVIPATGIMPMVMPTFSNAWKGQHAQHPTQISVPARSRDMMAARPERQMTNRNRASKQRRTGKTELLRHGGEDEVGRLLGT